MICAWRAPVRYPLDALVGDLRYAIDRTQRHTRVHPRGRLHAWLRALEDLQRRDRRSVAEEMVRSLQENLERVRKWRSVNRDGEPDLTALWDFPFRDAFRSLLEARMFVHVVRHLETKLQPRDWKTLVEGNLRPEDDRQNTSHRDHLLELYVASAADAAGMAVELSEPDVVVDVAGHKLGIAAKRIKSRRQVLPNAKKGAEQIQRSATGRGIVFLDVSHVMNRQMAAMRYLRDFHGQGSGSVHGHLMKFASEHRAILQLLNEPHVEGIILRHAVPAMLAKSFVPATLETWSPIVERPSRLTIAVYGGILDALSPSVVPQPGVGALWSAPCEFSFAHL